MCPVDGLSQGEGYEIARYRKVSVLDSGLGHTGVGDAFSLEPLYAVSLPGAESILLLASRGLLNCLVNNASIRSKISSELGWKRRQRRSAGNS